MQPLVIIAIVLTAALGAFGREIPSRIVGGSDAPDGKYPYMVSLGNPSHMCGGAIINKRWILTAGHCLARQTSIQVLAGTISLKRRDTVYQSDLLLERPGYDIGLIRVNVDIEFNEKVQPVPLPESDFTEVDYPSAIVTGWGRLSSSDFHEIITEREICTLTKFGEGTCRGDSGSPLTAYGVLIGVVSRGIPCARGAPDIYSRVWTSMGWIRETIEQNS